MKTILVTGAAGFIGRHVCRNLVRGGFTVVGITRDKVATSETANSSYPLVAVDLRQGCEIQSTLASLGQRRLDAVIHLAAQISPTLLGEEAERAATTNCLLDENVFRFCANRRIPAVYASGTVV